MPEFYVQIIDYDDEKVIKEMGPFSSEKKAEKIEDGANINLNHEKFYTIVEQK